MDNTKKFKGLKFVFSTLIAFSLIAFNANANEFGLPESEFNDINEKVNNMNYAELVSTRASLLDERNQLQEAQGSTQSPSQMKAMSNRLAEIAAELSAIQKALIAIAGLGAIPH